MNDLRVTSDAVGRWRRTAQVLKALGHPSRLLLVDRLAGGECCVCELTALVGADVSTVSRHLAVLREAGIVADERRGAQVFYRLVAADALEVVHLSDRVVRGALAREQAAVEPLLTGEQGARVGSVRE